MEGTLHHQRFRLQRTWIALILGMITIVPASGCLSLMAQTLWVLKGHDLPARCDALEHKRVAVVCVSDASAYGPDAVTLSIEKLVTAQLANNVKKIQMIPQRNVENWRDANRWDNLDAVELGRGVNADRLVWIELDSYSLHEGSTMLKGRSRVTCNVYDIENDGTIVFTTGEQNFVHPRDGQPNMQTTERKFEANYLARLATFLAQDFYKHDRYSRIENDSNF